MSMSFFRRIKRSAKDKAFGSTKDTASGVQQLEMADARLGVLYFLGNTRLVHTSKLDVGLVGTFLCDTEFLGDLKKASTWIIERSAKGKNLVDAARNVRDKVSAAVSSAIKPITDLLKRFFNSLKEKIKGAYGTAWDGFEAISEYFVWAAGELSEGLAKAIPAWGYVQSAADAYNAAKTAIVGTARFINQLYSGRGVQLMGGHPSIIANALARHSLAMIGSGLTDFALAGVKIGLQAGGDAFAGAGTLVSVISGILSRIVALIDRYIQRLRVISVLDKARRQWRIHNSDACIAANHKAFSEWFQDAVITTPIIAALTLGSGFAAHPYRFLQLLDTNNELVTQAQFDAGVRHIEKLKSLAGKYVDSYTDDYRCDFVSDDPVVAARLLQLIHGEGIMHTEPVV